MKVKHIMTRDVIAGHPELPVETAKELMRRHHISGLPVIDAEGSVVGIFSQTDALVKEGQSIGELMTSPAITVDEETAVKDAAAIMAAKDINRIPVLCQGHLVGIVSRADVVRFVATSHAWHEPEGQVRDVEACG